MRGMYLCISLFYAEDVYLVIFVFDGHRLAVVRVFRCLLGLYMKLALELTKQFV